MEEEYSMAEGMSSWGEGDEVEKVLTPAGRGDILAA
jgi:hypothetical protein